MAPRHALTCREERRPRASRRVISRAAHHERMAEVTTQLPQGRRRTDRGDGVRRTTVVGTDRGACASVYRDVSKNRSAVHDHARSGVDWNVSRPRAARPTPAAPAGSASPTSSSQDAGVRRRRPRLRRHSLRPLHRRRLARSAHALHDSGIAVEKLVTDGTPVPVVASYGMTSGSTPPEGITAPMLYYDPAHPPAAGEIAGKILVFETAPYPAAAVLRTRSSTTTRRPTTSGAHRASGRRCSCRRRRASPARITAAGSGVS